MTIIKKAFKYIFRTIIGFVQLKINQIKWLISNQHNKTRVGNYFPLELVKVGRYSYGLLIVHHFGSENEGLEIGDFCSIGPNVEFFLGGEHHPKLISNYPFALYFSQFREYSKCDRTGKGKIYIEDDVWIGANSVILSGVTIGQGAVVGAGSVVAKDIPPYAIYANGKVIKKRFSEDIVSELERFDYSKLDIELLEQHIEDFYDNDIKNVINKEWINQIKKD